MQKITMTSKGILMARRIFKWHEMLFFRHETRNELVLFRVTTIAASLKKEGYKIFPLQEWGKELCKFYDVG